MGLLKRAPFDIGEILMKKRIIIEFEESEVTYLANYLELMHQFEDKCEELSPQEIKSAQALYNNLT